MISKIGAFLSLMRPVNVIIAAFCVYLGVWLTHDNFTTPYVLFLIGATMCALGYGNVINDIKDIDGDRMNHPSRPLPSGKISLISGKIWALMLALGALWCGFNGTIFHFWGTIIPLILLTIYTVFLKGVPLVGNVLVSLLVGYTIIFGGFGGDEFSLVIIPAGLATLLNLIREIIKDLEDKEGDEATGILTTASLSPTIVHSIVKTLGLLYIPLSFYPWYTGDFGMVYGVMIGALIIPLHCYWLFGLVIFGKSVKLRRISSILKGEMFLGLIILAADRLWSVM